MTKSDGKLCLSGVYVSLHLSLLAHRQVADLQAKVRTGLGKTDRPGSQGGLRKRGYGSRTEVHGESRETTTGPYGKRAEDLSRQRRENEGHRVFQVPGCISQMVR